MSGIEAEQQIQIIGRRLLRHLQRRRLFHPVEWLIDRTLQASMRDDEVRGSILRFVDLLPALKTSGEVLRLLQEHLQPVRRRLPLPIRWGTKLVLARLIPQPFGAWLIRKGVERFARQFIAATRFRDTAGTVRALRRRGWGVTFDILGEAVTSQRQAERYRDQLCELMRELHREKITDINIALKFSAFDSQLNPANWEGCIRTIQASFETVLGVARETGATLWVDPEKYEDLELMMEVFRRGLRKEGPFGRFDRVGIGLQAYLKDAAGRLKKLLQWTAERGTKIGVRLIKGAYWDYEVMHAEQMGWEIPVWTQKWQSDRNFETLTDLLLENRHLAFVAFGTHNARSIASAMAKAKSLGATQEIEFQALYGMADRLKEGIVGEGFRLRVYTPFTVDGQYIPGMAYLSRRILENTSQESFLRQASGKRIDTQGLLQPPRSNGKIFPLPKVTVDPALAGYRPTAFTNFSHPDNRTRMEREMIRQRPNPVSSVHGREVDAAVDKAVCGWGRWKETSIGERSRLLLAAADLLEGRRFEFAALAVNEGGKSWREADADVVEAIEAIRFAAWDLRRLEAEGILGKYASVGPTAVIPPWNFPLAIPAIGASSALAAGNTVLLKPAEQTPFIALRMVELFHEAGVPPDVLQLVPGAGDVGRQLVGHPKVAVVAFTGSEAVGREIYTEAWRKKIISEMGGKNAILVSATADLDEAVEGVVESAFGHSGQKCSAASRVIVQDTVYGEFLAKLVDAASSLPVAPASDPAARVVPLIDDEAEERVAATVKAAGRWGRVLLDGLQKAGDTGSAGGVPRLIGPTVVADVLPESELAQKEIFGPVLAVIRGGKSVDEMLEIADRSRYALTGGIFTRSPAERECAIRRLDVGNLYINQRITGARIGVQPFGGFRSSGTGAKTGGPDYLLKFLKLHSEIYTPSSRVTRCPKVFGFRQDPEKMTARGRVARAVRPYAIDQELRELIEILPDEQLAPVQLPGQVNFLRYEPLGEGLILVAPDATDREIASTFAAAAMAGNRIVYQDLGRRDETFRMVDEFCKEGIPVNCYGGRPYWYFDFVAVVGRGIPNEELATATENHPEVPHLCRLIREPVSLRDRFSVEQFRRYRAVTVVTQRHGHLESFW